MMTSNQCNVLFLYNPHYTHIPTVHDYLNSFKIHSSHSIHYLPAIHDLECGVDLQNYDAVMIHYSLRSCYNYSPGTISKNFEEKLKDYQGLKILFIQDEYEQTNRAIAKINDLGIHHVFTCVPEESIEKVYPPLMLPGVKFSSVLTGYVPDSLLQKTGENIVPFEERSLWLSYRGRELPYIYGELGREKYEIGIRMSEICALRGVPADIKVQNNDRIYGDAWHKFIASSRATLGTESGANIFDFDGSLSEQVKTLQANNPDTSFDEVYQAVLKEHDHRIKMNQISPKLFEAIALKTALVLFEGEYSGVIQPDIHYIPLKKDFSNVEDVLDKLSSIPYLTNMTERAFHDVITIGGYSYKKLVDLVDATINHSQQSRKSCVAAFHQFYWTGTQPTIEYLNMIQIPSSIPLKMSMLKKAPPTKKIQQSYSFVRRPLSIRDAIHARLLSYVHRFAKLKWIQNLQDRLSKYFPDHITYIKSSYHRRAANLNFRMESAIRRRMS